LWQWLKVLFDEFLDNKLLILKITKKLQKKRNLLRTLQSALSVGSSKELLEAVTRQRSESLLGQEHFLRLKNFIEIKKSFLK
jgi:hypothetical protein